jgi:hypothetical protein
MQSNGDFLLPAIPKSGEKADLNIPIFDDSKIQPVK